MYSLRKLSDGECVTAQAFNALVEAIEEHGLFSASSPLEITNQAGGAMLDLVPTSTLEFARLDEDIEPNDADRQATPLRHDAAASGDPWVQTARELTRLVDPNGGTYLAGERHACWFQADSGKFVPLVGVHFHLGKVDAAISPGGSGTVSVWRVASGTPSDSTLNVAAYDWLGDGIAAGAAVYVLQHPQSREWYAIARHVSISQFSKTSNQTITAPTSGSTQERIKFDTQVESQGGADVNGRVVLTTSGSDQGIMQPAAGHYLVSAAGTLSVSRNSTGLITDASNASPIVITTSGAHPFADGDQIWLRDIGGNLAANGLHTVANKTSTTFELAGSTGSGAFAVGGPTETAVEVPTVCGTGLVELRRKPSGGSWQSYRASRFDFRFMPLHPDATLALPLVIPQFEVTAEADDQFELSIVVQGEDVTISASGDFDPAGNVRVCWERMGG